LLPDRLVLFDIDGTLLWPNGAGRASMKLALEKVYGTSGPIDSYSFGGHTDRDTVHTLMGAAGLPATLIDENFPQMASAMQHALENLVQSQRHAIKSCPGGPELVSAVVIHERMLSGLVTGNLGPSAAIKLRAAGYNPADFEINAFGDISQKRADLVTHAINNARERTGVHFSGKQVVIIGDTPADILCGRHVDARTIIVLTGWSSKEELEALSPDFIFEDMTDTNALLEAILE
jgi:phosphoglycolate phosphatase-like HAD superfamily hydrolase